MAALGSGLCKLEYLTQQLRMRTKLFKLNYRVGHFIDLLLLVVESCQ